MSCDTMGTVGGGDSLSSHMGSAESASFPPLVVGFSPMYASAMSLSISSSLCPATEKLPLASLHIV